jgi:hypothetical protein
MNRGAGGLMGDRSTLVKMTSLTGGGLLAVSRICRNWTWSYRLQMPMRVYRSKTLLSDNADFGAFTTLYAQSVIDKSADPFLLVRDDDSRLLIVTDDGSVMLCLANGPNDCMVSYASSYSDRSRQFVGLSGQHNAKDENFVDPRFAIKAIHAFFDQARMSEHVDFRCGAPDSEITIFPLAITARKRVERELVEMRVEVPRELRADMQEVCEYLDGVADDPDENIDFDDAIQIGSLCGGRLNRRHEIYEFSYFQATGDVWAFKVPRTILDGIADGSIDKLTVNASVPKTVANKAEG